MHLRVPLSFAGIQAGRKSLGDGLGKYPRNGSEVVIVAIGSILRRTFLRPPSPAKDVKFSESFYSVRGSSGQGSDRSSFRCVPSELWRVDNNPERYYVTPGIVGNFVRVGPPGNRYLVLEVVSRRGPPAGGLVGLYQHRHRVRR